MGVSETSNKAVERDGCEERKDTKGMEVMERGLYGSCRGVSLSYTLLQFCMVYSHVLVAV